ncbi:1-aminocyclopropane-1-carboxylate oxidase homolog [Rhodamnia argentea]|uniref:1-aminocyclopropane-1-carboxylate oxidase homolog n=1 Tax=Rhodamnia argentea TaxID=178133 RepID=A0ABM3HX63_9MYRT|nr:1-aminocyclopropane-1-carboxylate oxidase homolog [Rhodamnia argentea]
MEGSCGLFEQETEAKNGFYTGDITKRVIYNSNMALYNSAAADWRDSIFCSMGPEPSPARRVARSLQRNADGVLKACDETRLSSV